MAIRGSQNKSWIYLYDDHIFHAHQKKGNSRIEPEGDFTSAPAGKYRCKEHRNAKSACKSWVIKSDEDKKIYFRTSDPEKKAYLHSSDPLYLKKYHLYLKLRQEVAKSFESASAIVKRIINTEE